GRVRGPRPDVPRRGVRMARAGLLDVPRDERRPPRAGRALRVDVEPQLRGPPGRRRPHASRESGDGGRGRHRRPFRRRPSTVLDPRGNAMKKMLVAWLALAGLALAVAGCNTVEGVGKDVKATGNAIEKAADKA